MARKQNRFSQIKKQALRKAFVVCVAIQDEQHYREIVDLLVRPSVDIISHGTLRQVENQIRNVLYADKTKRKYYLEHRENILKKRKARYQEQKKRKQQKEAA